MTVYEASGSLYVWFSENDSFSIKDDFLSLIKISETPERDKASFRCALDDLASAGLIMSIDEEIWVLKKPFGSYDQKVEIPADIAITMAEIINNFCDTIGNQEEKCNPSDIGLSDFKNLIYIASHLIEDKRVDLNGEME